MQTYTVEKMCWLNQEESKDSCQNPWNKIHKDCSQRPKLATKFVGTLCPKGASSVLRTSKGENKPFLPQPLHAMLCRCSSYLQKTTFPNFEWRGGGRSVDSFDLCSYLIWVQCLNNFVTDCSYSINLKTSGCFSEVFILIIKRMICH